MKIIMLSFVSLIFLSGCTVKVIDSKTEASIANEEYIQEQKEISKSLNKSIENLDYANDLDEEIKELQSSFAEAVKSGDDEKIDEISARLDELIEEAERRLNE